MNPLEDAENFQESEPESDEIFYEPHTIPARWDLSEYLPNYIQTNSLLHLSKPED